MATAGAALRSVHASPSGTTLTCVTCRPVNLETSGGSLRVGTEAVETASGGTDSTAVHAWLAADGAGDGAAGVWAKAACDTTPIHAERSNARRRIRKNVSQLRQLLELESPSQIHAEIAERRRRDIVDVVV